MLSVKEKESLRVLICKFRVTPEILDTYALKTDEEIRAILALDKSRELNSLMSQKVEIEAKIAELKE